MTASFLNQKTLCKPHGASVFSTPDINGQKSDEIAPHPADLCPDTHRYRRRIAAHLHTIVPAAALPLRKPPPWQGRGQHSAVISPVKESVSHTPAGICFNPAVNRMLQSSAPPHRKQFDRDDAKLAKRPASKRIKQYCLVLLYHDPSYRANRRFSSTHLLVW